ncbi:MAG: glutamate-cysteine ligase family protein, partial [Myxococcota bacterium]
HEANGALVGLKGDGQSVSLEPGGQLEFASRPHRSLKKLRQELFDYMDDLKAAAGDNLGFWAIGQQPFVDRHTAPKMPKPRYDLMRRFFGQRGRRALDMMHLTGSVQCTVDFLDERNLVNKVRTAVKASPFLTALVAASPFSSGRANGFKSVRYQIWLETDEHRSGIWPEMLDEEGLTVRRYIERAMTAAPVFFIRDGKYLAPDLKPFAHFRDEGFAGTDVTVADFLDHLTTFFPEVRAKGYVEMRGADCLPPAWAVAIAGFWRALLDDEECRQEVDDRLRAMDFEALRALQPEIATRGLEADSPAGPVVEVARWLSRRAYDRLAKSAPDCAECVLPLVEQAQKGMSPADEMLTAVASGQSIEEALRPFEV